MKKEILAKEILKLNPTTSLTGTLMLKIRGIEIGREPKDIDILIFDYPDNIIFPKGYKVKKIGLASNRAGAKYLVNDIIVDVMSSTEKPEIHKGFKLGKIEGLLKAKRIYSTQNNEGAEKHKRDLVKLEKILKLEL